MTSLVTGALSYTGRHIAQRLMSHGEPVRTLVNDPAAGRIRDPEMHARLEAVLPYEWDRYKGMPADEPWARDDLAAKLAGCETLYNTYWIRYPHAGQTHQDAVTNTLRLMFAAERAGVQNVVHVSIAHADPRSPYPYHRGKGLVEDAIRDCMFGHAILRPTVLFGGGDVLINNIAYLLRRSPLFPLAGDGRYGIRPVHVRDLAHAATLVPRDNCTVDVAGPEHYTFAALVRAVRKAVGSRSLVVPRTPRPLLAAASRVLGRLLDDTLLTRDEIGGLVDGLCSVEGPAFGTIPLGTWLECHGATLGLRYANDRRGVAL